MNFYGLKFMVTLVATRITVDEEKANVVSMSREIWMKKRDVHFWIEKLGYWGTLSFLFVVLCLMTNADKCLWIEAKPLHQT